MTIQLYVVEDHALMRETIEDYFLVCDDVEVCGTAGDAEEACAGLATLDPTVVLLDLSLPDRSGLDLLEEVQQRWQIPCVVLSGHGERSYVQRALNAGASGYVVKGKPNEIRSAVRDAADGRRYLSSCIGPIGSSGAETVPGD